MGRWCSPLTKAFDPVFYGLENVPSDPGAKLMFVGNHTMMVPAHRHQPINSVWLCSP
jgi:hypothetical protein